MQNDRFAPKAIKGVILGLRAIWSFDQLYLNDQLLHFKTEVKDPKLSLNPNRTPFSLLLIFEPKV